METLKTFSFPADVQKIKNENLEDKNVCVVTVVGKSPFRKSKSAIFRQVLDRESDTFTLRQPVSE